MVDVRDKNVVETLKSDVAKIGDMAACAGEFTAKISSLVREMTLLSAEIQNAALRATIDEARDGSDGNFNPEDLADAADATAILAGIQAGEIETFPSEVARRMIEGDNPVRVFREFRNMTGEELAMQVGISRPYLSQIETGKRQATFVLMANIARKLDISLDLLAPSEDEMTISDAQVQTMNDAIKEL